MPVIQLENAFLDNLSAEEPSPASSAISNLLDSIKLSSKFKPMPEANMKRAPPGTDKINAQQTLFPYRPDIKPSPDTSQQTTKSHGMMNFTAITESLSASSEDISEAIGKTFGLFNGNSFLKEPTEIDMSETGDVHNFYNTSSNWAALAVPPGFRQSRSAEDYSTKQLQRTIPAIWSFDNPDKDMTRSERARSILQEIATKTFETEIARDSYGESEFATTWGEEEETSDLRNISIMDNDSLTEAEESVFDDEEDDSDDDSVDTFQTTDTEHDDNFVFGGDQEGLSALGTVLYQLGTCTFDMNATGDEYSNRGRSRSPRTPPPERMNHPGLERVQSYLGFSEERELRRLQGGVSGNNENNKPRGGQGIFNAMFSCGGPMP